MLSHDCDFVCVSISRKEDYNNFILKGSLFKII